MGVEDSHRGECALHGGCELDLLLLVRLARGEEDYKEGEEQRDEVGVGDQPALVVDVLGMFFLAHAVASFGLTAAGLESKRKGRSLVSIMRGFMPSRMEMTPSSIISLILCSSRWRNLSLPAAGRQMRLAIATP